MNIAPPTAYDGVVYVPGHGAMYAVSEADGHVRWSTGVLNGDDSSPEVDDAGVYVSYSCQMNNRLDLGGQPVWTYWSGACAGGGGSTSVVRVK